MIVSWPARHPDDRRAARQYTHAIDIVPTIFELPRASSCRRSSTATRSTRSRARASRRASTTPTRDTARRRSSTRCSARGRSGTRAGRPPRSMPAAPERGATSPAALGALRHRGRPERVPRPRRASSPEKLQELIALWWAEAGKYGALPLESRDAIEILGTERPQLSQAARPLHLLPGLRGDPRVGRAEHPQPLVHDRRRGEDRHAPRRAASSSRRARASAATRSTSRTASSSTSTTGSASSSRSSSRRADPDRRTSSSPRRSSKEGDAHADRGNADASTSATRRSARRRSRRSRASSRSPAKGSTSARKAPSRSPTTTPASYRGRSSAGRSTRRSSTSAGEPWVDLETGARRRVRSRLTGDRARELNALGLRAH